MKLTKAILPLLVTGMVALAANVSAITLDSTRLIGKIVPGTPANPANENEMVNFFVVKYNGGSANGSLGDNPNDPQTEEYVLQVDRGVTGVVPDPGSLDAASSTGAVSVVSNNTTINVGTLGFTYVLAKFGQDAVVFYISGLTGEITLANLVNTQGLSGYSLFNPGGDDENPPPRVPDAGSTLALLGLALGGFGFIRRKVNA